MGALYEVIAPTSQRGTRVDLGLQVLRNATSAGRVRLALEQVPTARAQVIREAEAPRDAALDTRLAAIGDALCAVTHRAFVRPLQVLRALEGETVGFVCEYAEGRVAQAPADPATRVRLLRTAGAALFESLGALARDHGLAHGAIRPSNLLLSSVSAQGDARHLRVFDLGVGALASALVEHRAQGVSATSLEAAFAVAEPLASFAGALCCTATTWGFPGYVPLDHFAIAARPSRGTDLFGALVSLWELLAQRPLVRFSTPGPGVPWGTRALRTAFDADAALRALVEEPTRRDQLRALLIDALPGANGGPLGNWVDFFDQWISRGARDPSSLDAETLAVALTTLPDVFATHGTIPIKATVSTEGEAPDVSLLDAELPAVITLEPGRDYRAEVVLDYFAGDGDGAGVARTLRFRHVSMLGEGAMGSVHRVDILRPGEASLPAALKLAIDDSVHNRDALLREAHVLRAQRLDGMTQFLALIELPGRALALLMSYQPGVPLETLIQSRRLTSAEAYALGRRLFGTLVALHADVTPDDPAEVVHGDIKPGNVIVPLDARERPDFAAAVLIDFGVSRLRLRLATPPATTTAAAASEVLGGTVGYMPVGHLQKGATPASDVFAVAAVLYESLTGRRPWEVPDAEKYSPFGYAYAMEKAMRDGPHARVNVRTLAPWRGNIGWNSFFRTVLGGGDPARIPAARNALDVLERVRRDVSFFVVMGVALLVLGAAGFWWFRTEYCPTGQVRCGNRCTDLMHNARNCGACGHACSAGEVCNTGRCSVSCADGLTLCAGTCRELTTDRAHCGACGHTCGAGEVCSAGRCSVSCGGGLTLCGATCRDTRTDRAHCGACNRTCAAGQVCASGRCVTSCGGGLTACGGVCRDLMTDRAHCGECNRPCESGRVCSGGRCVTSCGGGTTECAGSCRDLMTDRSHCGGCGRACGAGENCTQGRCRQECPPGLSLCDGRCRDTGVDPSHCGTCGNGCNRGERCEGGRCLLSCPTGLSECGGSCRDIGTDRVNCGACGRSCGAGEQCEGGRCALACALGQVPCAGACREVSRDEDHCGSCGRACERGALCEGGRCVVVCGAGLTYCGDRCRDLDGDLAHCGACGRTCGRNEACVHGVCRSLAMRGIPQIVVPGGTTLPPTLPGGTVLQPPPPHSPVGGGTGLPTTMDLTGGPTGGVVQGTPVH